MILTNFTAAMTDDTTNRPGSNTGIYYQLFHYLKPNTSRHTECLSHGYRSAMVSTTIDVHGCLETFFSLFLCQ